jgi:hypothetical protein
VNTTTPPPRIVLRLLGLAGKLLLAVGLVGALVFAAALVVAVIAFREHLHYAVDGFTWSGSCLGAGGGCLWLQQKLAARR